MESLTAIIQIGAGYTAGDGVDLYVDDVKQNAEPIALFPHRAPIEGYGEGQYGVTPYGDAPSDAGYGDGVYGLDAYGQPAGTRALRTAPLYYGRHAVRVETVDYLGNPSPEPGPQQAVFLNTGPTAPKNLRFDSQTGAGPVTFSFDPSAEFAI